MKAVVAGSPGQIEWIEMDEPSVEPGGVLLRSLACGVCSTDVKLVRAGYSTGPRYALGHELVGEVVAVGDGAKWRIGDRVAAAPYHVAAASRPHAERPLPAAAASRSRAQYGGRPDPASATWTHERRFGCDDEDLGIVTA